MPFEIKENDSGMPYEQLTLPSDGSVRVEIDGDCTWGGLTPRTFYYNKDYNGSAPTEYEARRAVLLSVLEHLTRDTAAIKQELFSLEGENHVC